MKNGVFETKISRLRVQNELERIILMHNEHNNRPYHPMFGKLELILGW
jgi:hypothetical protein